MRVAIVGGGISGLTAAWQLHQLGASDVTLFEASRRLGGTVQTVRRDGFVIEAGPDGWVSEKPWATQLATELGVADELIGSNDAGRVTYIVQHGRLVAMPDGMRMMVPTKLTALEGSALFSAAAIAAYKAEPARAAELKALTPSEDESIASFVRRHFGDEVLTKIAGPLLGGVFGGDVAKLSVRAVMPRFVELEREAGSLVQALAGRGATGSQTVFTSLRSGVQTLVDSMAASLPKSWLHLGTPVTQLEPAATGWQLSTKTDQQAFDAVLLAVPAHIARRLLQTFDKAMADLVHMEASSAVLCALAFLEDVPLPAGFGFLAPQDDGSDLLAGTFVDQKFPGRVPQGCRLLRGFYGGMLAEQLASVPDEQIASRTLADLAALLDALPPPAFSVVSRWPQSLPQYGVGHLERMAKLASLIEQHAGLCLLGNAYRGVGLPDLVRDARDAARRVIQV